MGSKMREIHSQIRVSLAPCYLRSAGSSLAEPVQKFDAGISGQRYVRMRRQYLQAGIRGRSGADEKPTPS